MSNIDIKFYLVCQYFGIKSFIMGPICIFPFGLRASSLSLPFYRFYGLPRLNNKWTNPYGEFRKFYGAINGRSISRPRLHLRHLLLLFRGYAPLSSNTYAWHLLNCKSEKNFVPSSKLDTSSSKTPQHKSTCPFTS
jgi:hypothetical protein